MTGKQSHQGFTLVELLVVLAIVATLLAVVTPRYLDATERARETALRANLQAIRIAIDQFHGDRGSYPSSLDELVRGRYLRSIPDDPVAGDAQGWVLIPAPADAAPRVLSEGATTGPAQTARAPGIYDVRSSASGTTRDGIAFGEL